MDSYFKAAVCDLDKLLDDFELNSEEPAVFPFSSSTSTSSWPSSDSSTTVSTNLPNLNLLRYGSPSSLYPDHLINNHNNHNYTTATDETEATKVLPLTAVDLLSSVDRRQEAKTDKNTPPCPDRALKPVCDLVNDTGSAILVRADSHDAFGELDAVERQMEQEEALLVDFERPVFEGNTEEAIASDRSVVEDKLSDQALTQISSLASLDIILPLATEALEEQANETNPCEELASQNDVRESSLEHSEGKDTESIEGLEETQKTASENEENDSYSCEETEKESKKESPSDYQSMGLSCLPLAVSMCGALVKNANSEQAVAQDDNEDEGISESIEADRLSPVDDSLEQNSSLPEAPVAFSVDDARLSPVGASSEGLRFSPDVPNQRSVDPKEFGFEYLPESDQQAEMLVTDEELDAFLQAHEKSEKCVESLSCSRSVDSPVPMRISESCKDLEGHLDMENDATLEGFSSVESDKAAILASVDQNLEGNHSSSPSSSSTSNAFQSQHSISIDHGGARPKTLHCQNSRSSSPPPPAVEAEAEEFEQGLNVTTTSETHQNVAEIAPSETEKPSDANECSAIQSSQEKEEFCSSYDEMSEPPPYPGEDSAGSSQSADWKTEGREEEEEEVEGETELGNKQPEWIPDAEAPNCMNCSQKFTFTRRRHHCRACGKVFCGVCCNRKCKLKYLEKEARVCVICFDSIRRAEALERMMSPTGPSPNPNVPSEYCSTIPPLQQARAAGTLNSPPPTVMVPVSVLKGPATDSCPREHKRVWFADGILPNGEFADTTKLSVTPRRSGDNTPDLTPSPGGPDSSSVDPSPAEVNSPVQNTRPLVAGPWDIALLSVVSSSVKMVQSLIPENHEELPPLLITTGENTVGDVLVEECPAPCQILHLLEEGGPRPLMFVLNANLLINLKIVSYSGRQCWCFGSTGLQALGQKELVFLLQCLPEEKTLPHDIFTLYLNIYQDALNGKFLEDLDNITFTSSFLGSKDHAGMLFFCPRCQSLEGLSLPAPPFLCGLLIHKLEVPWAKVFPLRLLLRLGSQYQVYPTALTSVRFRESVYRETGHTIMNLLSDLRNYQYSLTVVEGLRIHMELGRSYIEIPKTSFNEMLKVVNSSNEHVISVGATFSSEADSHLVCFQNEEGNHQTQVNSQPGKTRAVTGASFVVFNGALKPSSGFIAKSSIVEDGLMVQIPPETMDSLRVALRDQRDFDIPCGKSDEAEVRETVTVRWIDWSSTANQGRHSGVDGRPLDGVQSLRVQQDTEFITDGRSIRCTEVFCALKSPEASPVSVMSACSGFQKDIALATCSALSPQLTELMNRGINCVWLRVSTQTDMVEYQAGSRGALLPQSYMNDLDSSLIPVIHGGGSGVPQTHMDLEFVFYISHALQ